MSKLLVTTLLSVTLTTPLALRADTDSDCSMVKHMAGHALTMIKGGATLEQTLSLFESSTANSSIIKEIFAHKDSLKTPAEAGKFGDRMCLQQHLASN